MPEDSNRTLASTAPLKEAAIRVPELDYKKEFVALWPKDGVAKQLSIEQPVSTLLKDHLTEFQQTDLVRIIIDFDIPSPKLKVIAFLTNTDNPIGLKNYMAAKAKLVFTSTADNCGGITSVTLVPSNDMSRQLKPVSSTGFPIQLCVFASEGVSVSVTFQIYNHGPAVEYINF